ncbi:MAG: relaxase/mobilization nuclease domain-containing protein [Capnocytophaga sp.]|nr:relaxase/mobilization nuclease domain-containing protein [Capnocytophaga sp.]
MIVKLLSSASVDFHGVKYNEKKINSERGELMKMNNFPTFLNEESSQEEVRNYLKAISNTGKVKNPQFHAVISTKFQEHSKEQLTEIAESFMQEMGYEKQPYLIVFHKDTENNHVHIVSTRVDKDTGKKIKDNFEKLKSQKALANVLEKHFGIDRTAEIEKLLQYKVSNFQQMENLLTKNGFKVRLKEDNPKEIEILHNGIVQKSIHLNEIPYENHKKEKKDKRIYQIKQFIEKYKQIYSNKVFKVIDDREENGLYERNPNADRVAIAPKIEYQSELQKKLHDIFGIDIVFHFKDNKQPFGYTLIDNIHQKVYKGSEIMKMNDIFEFTPDSIHKEDFERLKAYNLDSSKEKEITIQLFANQGITLKDFMLFSDKRQKDNEKSKVFQQIKTQVKEFMQEGKEQVPDNEFITLLQDNEGEYYAVHQRYHRVYALEKLIGNPAYEVFTGKSHTASETGSKIDFKHNNGSTLSEAFQQMEKAVKILGQGTYVGKDPTEEELKKRRKKRK